MVEKYISSSDSAEWITPPEVFEPLMELYKFQVDLAATDETKRTEAYCGNFFHTEWITMGDRFWLNPPYGRSVPLFVRNVAETIKEFGDKRKVVVCLIAARTDTQLWQDVVMPYAKKVDFVRGRINFMHIVHDLAGTKVDYVRDLRGRPVGAPFPSAIVRFGGEPSKRRFGTFRA